MSEMRIDKLADQVRALRAFAQTIMDSWPAGDVDGADLQIAAVEHGLLVATYPTGSCGEGCSCAEYYGDDFIGAVCYKRTELLTGEKE